MNKILKDFLPLVDVENVGVGLRQVWPVGQLKHNWLFQGKTGNRSDRKLRTSDPGFC
jgi:hypothetical protein